MPDLRVHILGASGSGTSTLGASLAKKLECEHLDVDNFFWLPTRPPFQNVRPRQDRQALLGKALASCRSWILSGSLCGWGDQFIPEFDLVVFIWLPPDIRLARLAAREESRHGTAAISPGGDMFKQHQDFLRWAAAYDDGGLDIRSRQLHEQWLDKLACPVIRLEGDMTTNVQLAVVLEHIQQKKRAR